MRSSWHITDKDDLSEGLQAAVARRFHHQPIITLSTIDEESDSDAVEPPRLRWKPLKSGKLCMAESMMLKKVTWPHELVYTAMGQPAMYEDPSVTLFVL